MRDAAEELRQVFERVQFDVRIVFDLLCEDGHERLCEIGREVEEMKPFISLSMLRLATVQEHTGGQVQTRDRRALQGGIHMPAHLAARCALQHYVSHEDKLGELGKKLLRAKNLIEHMNQPTSQKTHGNKVFIGHGGADAWKDLRFFLGGKLGLDVDEFNMEPAAGLTTKERLEEMLEAAGIAFLVLTAEDEHEDGTVHARENVIHEAGLFQGRLGFRRAIILLEEGCEEFSNIAGITQIRFPEGNIMAKSEEIRGVLEREGFIE
jgi:predicted nucleotide-binding protein